MGNIRHSNVDSGAKSRSSIESKKRFNGNYLGIVVQNNDPDKKGQIKVWVPHIGPALYEGWDSKIKDKRFAFPGKNIESDLSGIIDDLKAVLPWARAASNIMGESSSGKYNSKMEVGTISDSNRPETITPKNGTFTATKYSLNADGIGEKPARIYEVDELRHHDAFNDVEASVPGSKKTGMPNRINKNTFGYKPSSYSNCAKGVFAIPSVGSHVWVFFDEGDPMKPVYFAASFGQEDWKGIYESNENGEGYLDYPGTYENKGKKENVDYDHNVETYRNKFVFNQKGGTMEIVNTDNRELFKLTHFSGSHLAMNNEGVSQFSAANDQKLVMADQSLTVRGYRSEHTELDYDLIVRGDFYQKIGTFNKEYMMQWKEIAGKIADVKQLFEIRRADRSKLMMGQGSASDQKKAGKGPAACPLCSEPAEKIWDIKGKLKSYEPVNKGISENEKSGSKWLTIGSFNVPIMGDSYDDSDKMSGDNFDSVTADTPDPKEVNPSGGSSNFLGGGTCPVCGGSGDSPSSYMGKWDAEEAKGDAFRTRLLNASTSLLEIEKKLGLGGNKIEYITKHKIESVGVIMNDLPSIRIDDAGKLSNNEVVVFPEGVATTMKEHPLVEPVHVDELPGGTSTLNIANKYNVQVGSGGVSIKSSGPVEIGGTIMNLGAEQINIASENEINIVAGKRVHIAADILSLRQSSYGQVLVDSNLGVSQNVVVGGAMHVEGELSVQHVTAPTEIQQTEQVALQGQVVTGESYYANMTLPIPCGAPGCAAQTQTMAKITFVTAPRVQTAAHSHQFRNLPLTLTEDRDSVRKQGSAANIKRKRMPASPIKHEKKTPSEDKGGVKIEKAINPDHR